MKWIIKVIRRDAIKSVTIISKALKVLRYLGMAVGPIIDTIVCILHIVIKRQRHKNGEITKKESYTYVAKQVGELATDLLITVLCGLCILIPIPIVNMIVSVSISIIGLIVAKLVEYLSGLAFDCIWDVVCRCS